MPICSGSRSIWTRRLGTGIRRQSVMTSVNRQPTASMASACGRTTRARADRAWPSESGLRSSINPLALSVVIDRRAEPSRQRLDRLGRARPERAAAGQDDRPLGPRPGSGRPRRSRRPARSARAAAGTRGSSAEAGQGTRIRSWGRNRADGRGRPRVIAWNARPTSAGIWSTRRSVPHHLRHRAEDPFEVDLVVVAALAIQGVGIDLAGDQQDRDGIGPALGDAGQRVGRAGPGGGADDAGLSRHPRRAVGGEGGGLLVADQERPDRAGPRQGVVDRRRVRARHPEQATHSPTGQALHQDIRAGLHRLMSSSDSGPTPVPGIVADRRRGTHSIDVGPLAPLASPRVSV